MDLLKRLKQSLSDLSPWSKTKKKRKRPSKVSKRKIVAKKPKKAKKADRKKGKTVPRLKPKITTVSKKKVPAKPRKALKPASSKKARVQKEQQGELLGHVTHYFPHVHAAAAVVESGTLSIGDTILIKGKTTKFKQTVSSLQINREPIQEAKPGDEIGIEVKSRARTHDAIYKLS
ncbi:MAG: EF-Tu/IF-2/RF-3 family GTPase [Candidatus Omnitrophica bacterium]|nr:EF-Tu/IF-2/RF-3 family GTPase [Candidatus Omnitrophota bacterium]MDD5672117.1 EF-Tu/IF-2/RF-3 family GTPase [Candidatus Omnitrophota bacterium]